MSTAATISDPIASSPLHRRGAGGEAAATSAFQRVMSSAPMGLLVSAALGLAIVGVFQYIFYLGILPAGWGSILRATLAAAIAAFFEALGLFFLITTVRDFSARARREGFIGLLATFLLWGYALWESTHVAAAFDRDTPETYWGVFGIIGTIVCIVRIVELRIALTVTSAIQRTDDRKTIYELTGKLHAFEAEKQRIEQEKADTEKAAAELIEQRREQEIAAAFAELDTLRRRLARADRTGSATIDRNKRGEIERKTREFYRKHDILPTQEQAAKLAGLGDARALRHHFPNGSWEAFTLSLQHEPQQENANNLSLSS